MDLAPLAHWLEHISDENANADHNRGGVRLVITTKGNKMKVVGLALTALFVGVVVASVPAAFALMILFGNLHVVFAAVPAISFWTALSLSLPAGFVVGAWSSKATYTE